MGVQGSGPASQWKQDGFLQGNLEGSWTVLRNFCWEMGSGLQGCPTGFHRDFRRFFPPTTVFSRSSPRLGVVSKAVLSGAVMTAASGDKSCCTCRNFPRGSEVGCEGGDSCRTACNRIAVVDRAAGWQRSRQSHAQSEAVTLGWM